MTAASAWSRTQSSSSPQAAHPRKCRGICSVCSSPSSWGSTTTIAWPSKFDRRPSPLVLEPELQLVPWRPPSAPAEIPSLTLADATSILRETADAHARAKCRRKEGILKLDNDNRDESKKLEKFRGVVATISHTAAETAASRWIVVAGIVKEFAAFASRASEWARGPAESGWRLGGGRRMEDLVSKHAKAGNSMRAAKLASWALERLKKQIVDLVAVRHVLIKKLLEELGPCGETMNK
ncbi:hypothetical protein CH63R_14646 [Colletotrichum higginsianum IMI 349063]|uniref:Uncharacterized protein n=1 Tax=Colletotrichum higginsianum (strain IMI 349063) TaxID=759273 RepID=A0A1B7XQS1_COLHI|nr:hypothetical protein CH63R_14646 [Colletotrichum higginsianum IMI 349063]OBR02074.1 hypothetical protein CH63R_14646 [Colletotrichum higginsianum IMI 349063]